MYPFQRELLLLRAKTNMPIVIGPKNAAVKSKPRALIVSVVEIACKLPKKNI